MLQNILVIYLQTIAHQGIIERKTKALKKDFPALKISSLNEKGYGKIENGILFISWQR
jgi:hypothetical protein